MGCLVDFSKRSYLGSCTLDHGTAVGNPNCGQSGADYCTRVPKSAGWSFCCFRSTSPEPERLSNAQFALAVFRCVVQSSFPLAFVIQCQACLQGNASHGHRSFLCQFSCLLPAHYAQVCSSTLQNSIFHVRRILAENTLLRTITSCRRFLTLWLGSQHRSPLQNLSMSVLRGRLMSSCSSLPSNPCPHVLSSHSSTVPPAVSLRVSSHRFQLFPRKCMSTSFAADRRQECGAFRMIATKSFCMRSTRFLPTDPAREQHVADQCPNTQCSWQAKCVFRMCLRTTGQVRQRR